ncbi:ABC transporter permease [Dactylosporangium sp. AC04546]|uniref:ABC transporter permease n=1 Tax=Dactylosporangium sp. AC04546 TaxID=2862460 RepID=UPI001EE149AA|nr:ABC transporter permease [Dactylosporangium sp. AC04546]WVK82509.1 ABC transporter permease [Dactylosporangium sp. AC04546]
MIRLALGTLRTHRAAYAGTFFAAVLAVALLCGAGQLLASVLTATPPADRFAAADAVVSGAREVSVTTTKHKKDKAKTKTKTERLTGAGTLPAGLADRLRAVPGVTAVVADTAAPVRIATPDGRAVLGADDAPVVAHGWASAAVTPFTLRSGHAPGPGEVVLDADLAARAGDTLVLTSRTGVRTVRVAGVAVPAGRAALPAQGALFLADADVAAVTGLAGPTAVAVFGSGFTLPSGTGQVLTGADKVRADLPGALPDYIAPISIFGFVIGLTGFAAVFVLTGTVTLGVRQRLRELALLRTAGATPGQLRRLLGLESLLLAGLASLVGAPLGIPFAAVVAARFRALGAVPAQFEVRVNVLVVLGAVAAGLLVAYAAARLAGRRVVRIAPTQALAETAVAPAGGVVPRVLAALVTTAGAVAVLTFVPLGGPLGMGMSFVSTALLLCAVAALGPLVVRPVTAVVSRVLGIGGATGRLAAMVTRAESRRVAAVAVPLVLMFALNAVMLLNGALLTDLAAAEQAARTAAATGRAPGGMPLAEARNVVTAPGVTGAAVTLPTRAIVVRDGKPEDYAAQGLLTLGAEPVLDLDVRAGALGGDGTFAASTYLADGYGWHVGDTVAVWLADGTEVPLRLSAVYARARGFGDLVLPAELVAAHDAAGLVGAVWLRGAGGSSAAAVAPAADSNQQGAWELMVVVSLGFTAVAVVNTFAMAAAGRRREFADLRLAGATAGQLHRLAAREALITVAVGLLLGALVTGVVTGVFSVAQDGTLRLFSDPRTYLTMLGTVGGLGLLAGVLPTRFAVRPR